MLRWIAALLLIPLLDAILLVYVAVAVLDPVLTVAIVVLTALVGMLAVRAEGRHTLARLQRAVGRGDPPTNEVIDGALLLVAGAFLLTPGLVTDALGFVLVVPPTRYVVRSALKRFVLRPYVEKKTGGFATGNVYTFGFPPNGARGDTGSGDATTGDTYDLGSDAYDVDVEDDDGPSRR